MEEIIRYNGQNYPEFYVRYPDNSFDKYYGGSVIDWGEPERYTYGAERNCFNLTMNIWSDNENMLKLKKGELVFMSGQDSYVYANIFPVIESGHAMSGLDPEGRANTLLWTKIDGSSYDYVDSRRNRPDRNIYSINGIRVGEETIFEKNSNNMYVTLKEGDTYTIGEVLGTQLFEKEYLVDMVYYLHTYHASWGIYEYEEEKYPFRLQPTTDGYAVVDLSDLPSGDYVVMYTYWVEAANRREQKTTHIRID